jgi:hypothetical protein
MWKDVHSIWQEKYWKQENYNRLIINELLMSSFFHQKALISAATRSHAKENIEWIKKTQKHLRSYMSGSLESLGQTSPMIVDSLLARAESVKSQFKLIKPGTESPEMLAIAGESMKIMEDAKGLCVQAKEVEKRIHLAEEKKVGYEQGYLSTSSKPAETFIAGNPSVVTVLKGMRGRDISSLSAYPIENEVLLVPTQIQYLGRQIVQGPKGPMTILFGQPIIQGLKEDPVGHSRLKTPADILRL